MAIIQLADFILFLINRVAVPLVFAIAFLVFIWGAYTYFISPENSGKREEARKYLLSAVIGFTVMVAIWGLVNIVVNTFGFNQTNRPALPYFGGSIFGSWGPGGPSREATGGVGSSCKNDNDCRDGLVCDTSPGDGRFPQCVPLVP